MLEELKNLKYSPSKESLMYFLCDVIGEGEYDSAALDVICSHAPGIFRLSSRQLIIYTTTFDWVVLEENRYSLSKRLSEYIKDKELLNDVLIKDTVNKLFDSGLINIEMFSYEAEENKMRFRNELLPLDYSSIRNTLINQGFFEVKRTLSQNAVIYLSDEYTNFVADRVKVEKTKYTLEQLKKKIEENEVAGELAERFVLNYERKRLPDSFSDQIRIISSIDVTAGYDIVSFDDGNSKGIDRYIEVKAVDQNYGFFWSENEYSVAKLKGTHYYLYLVTLTDINKENYKPLIINNPAEKIMMSDNWLVETQTFRIRHI